MRNHGGFVESAQKDLADQHRDRWLNSQASPKKRPDPSTLFFENKMCLSISEVAFALSISTKSVERLIRKGELTAKKVGRRRIVPRCDIEAWLKRKE